MPNTKTYYVKENSLIKYTTLQKAPKGSYFLWTELGDSSNAKRVVLRPDQNPSSRNDSLYRKRVVGWKDQANFIPLFHTVFQEKQMSNAYVNLFENKKDNKALVDPISVNFGYQLKESKPEYKADFVEISKDITISVGAGEEVNTTEIYNLAKKKLSDLGSVKISDIKDVSVGDFGKGNGSWKFNKRADKKQNAIILEDSQLLSSSISKTSSARKLNLTKYVGSTKKGKELTFVKYTTKSNKEYVVGVEFNNTAQKGKKNPVNNSSSSSSSNTNVASKVFLKTTADYYLVNDNSTQKVSQILTRSTLNTFVNNKKYKIVYENLGDGKTLNRTVKTITGAQLKNFNITMGNHATTTVLSILQGKNTKTFLFTANKNTSTATFRPKLKTPVYFCKGNQIPVRDLGNNIKSVRDICAEDNIELAKENGTPVKFRSIYKVADSNKCMIMTKGSGVGILQTRDQNNRVTNSLVFSRIAP